MAADKARWRYRFENFRRAFLLLREAIETMEERELSQLEKEGVIQRFEYSWELAWKTLKDLLEHDGVILETATPRSVLRSAFSANVIDNGGVWMKALDARNKMAHTYDFRAFEKIVEDIQREYLPLFDALHEMLMEREMRDGG